MVNKEDNRDRTGEIMICDAVDSTMVIVLDNTSTASTEVFITEEPKEFKRKNKSKSFIEEKMNRGKPKWKR